MEYAKIDDVTIESKQQIPGKGTLSRIFNFEAQQVTVLYDRLYDYSSWGNSLTSSMTVHNFVDLPNPAEIEKMHAKLVEMGGAPPALSTMEPFKSEKRVPNLDQAKRKA